jgi:hypothetical protein
MSDLLLAPLTLQRPTCDPTKGPSPETTTFLMGDGMRQAHDDLEANNDSPVGMTNQVESYGIPWRLQIVNRAIAPTKQCLDDLLGELGEREYTIAFYFCQLSWLWSHTN